MSDRSLRRLNRIAGEINAWLVVIAIGLATLDLVVLVALETPLAPAGCLNCDSIVNVPTGIVEPTAALAAFGQ